MKIRIIAYIIAVLMILPLTSCIGIGDGALIDNVQSNGSIECRITAHNERISDVLDEITLTGKDAEELLAYFTESEYYESIDSIMYPRAFTVSFYSYDENGESVPMYDSEGTLNEFFVQDTDTVYRDEAYLGGLKGAYEKLFGYIIEKGSTGGYFCNMSTDNAPHAIMIRASGESAYERYVMLSEGNYRTGMDRTANEKAYVILSFWGAEEATYYVYSDDYVEEYTNASLFKQLGHLDGIYDNAIALFKQTLNHVTAEEYDAGVKLNCLSVLIDNSVSRGYYVSDFEDVGCIYIDVLATDYYSYLVYFEACTREELDEKIVILEQIVGVKGVATVGVPFDNPALD